MGDTLEDDYCELAIADTTLWSYSITRVDSGDAEPTYTARRRKSVANSNPKDHKIEVCDNMVR